MGVRRAPPPESACGVRRRRRAFLPGRQPGPPRDHRRVRGTAPATARHHRDGGAGPTALRVHSRHQTVARRMDAALADRLRTERSDRRAVDVLAQVTRIVENGLSAGLFEFTSGYSPTEESDGG